MKVSVIIPSYNRAKMLPHAIESVLKQDYPDIECIVIDGGSNDDTVDVLSSYGARVRWTSEPDKGESDATNKGFRLATGDIIGWLSSDDGYAPGAFAACVEFFGKNANVAMVYGDYNIIDENGSTLKTVHVPEFSLDKLIRQNYIIQAATFFRRHVLDAVEFLDENLRYCNDSDLWLRIALKYPVQRVPQVLGNYRVHSDSITSREFRGLLYEGYFVVRRRYFPAQMMQHRVNYWRRRFKAEVSNATKRAIAWLQSHVFHP